MKTTNALVTYTDLSTMSLVPKGSPATGDRIATKTFINDNYYVNQLVSPYNGYSSLRCPPYQSIIAGPTNSGTIYFSYFTTYDGINYYGFGSAIEACEHSTGSSRTVYWSGTLGNGTILYLDIEPLNSFNSINGYYSLNGYSFQVDGSAIYNYAVCVCYSLPYTYTFYYDYDDSLPRVLGFTIPSAACDATNSVTVYSSSSSIGIGTTIWYNFCGTIPMQINHESQTQNNYRIGTDIIQFSDIDGSISSITACTPLATFNVATNVSVDIQIYLSSITVNSVTVINVTGADPNTLGNNGSFQTDQIGTYDVVIPVTAYTDGQSLYLSDSNGNSFCSNVNNTGGFYFITFTGVVINTTTNLTIGAQDGSCF